MNGFFKTNLILHLSLIQPTLKMLFLFFIARSREIYWTHASDGLIFLSLSLFQIQNGELKYKLNTWKKYWMWIAHMWERGFKCNLKRHHVNEEIFIFYWMYFSFFITFNCFSLNNHHHHHRNRMCNALMLLKKKPLKSIDKN